MDTKPRFRPPAVPPVELGAIRDRVRALREAAGLGQIELAERAGLSRSAVHQIEAGHSAPTLGTLYALADVLGCHVSDFFGRTGAKKKLLRKTSPAIDTED
jgi:transcriptional regulator with XRE-family HTH domain